MTSNTNIRLRETDEQWLAMDTTTGVTAKGDSREEVLENLDTAIERHANPDSTEPSKSTHMHDSAFSPFSTSTT